MSCSLCTPARQEFVYDDDFVWASYCLKHTDRLLIVLRRHTDKPTGVEFAHIMGVFGLLTANIPREHRLFRFGGSSIPGHYHIHQLYPPEHVRADE